MTKKWLRRLCDSVGPKVCVMGAWSIWGYGTQDNAELQQEKSAHNKSKYRGVWCSKLPSEAHNRNVICKKYMCTIDWIIDYRRWSKDVLLRRTNIKKNNVQSFGQEHHLRIYLITSNDNIARNGRAQVYQCILLPLSDISIVFMYPDSDFPPNSLSLLLTFRLLYSSMYRIFFSYFQMTRQYWLQVNWINC